MWGKGMKTVTTRLPDKTGLWMSPPQYQIRPSKGPILKVSQLKKKVTAAKITQEMIPSHPIPGSLQTEKAATYRFRLKSDRHDRKAKKYPWAYDCYYQKNVQISRLGLWMRCFQR